MASAGPDAGPVSVRPASVPVPRWAVAATSLGFLAICLAQAPGRLVADTKIDLAINPAALMSRALHAWDPLAGFGSLQNQTQGYLFPVAPLFAAAHAAGIPAWVAQRLWIGLLLAVACAGVIFLASALGIGSTPARVAGGVAYALSPALLILAGPLSSLVLPAALAPWAILPLVHGARAGSPMRAAARSGVAVALMGAVNSGTTAAVLVLPALWLLTRRPGPRRRALIVWWLVALFLACAWWALSGLVELKYGFGFLSYIERANATTATASATETLRGSANWIAHYFAEGRPWWQGGWVLVATPAAILASAVLAAGGLAGVARLAATGNVGSSGGATSARQPWLAVAVLAGLVLTAAAYAGPLGGPLATGIQHLLDGPLSVFRSINKFQPVVTLPLALGLIGFLDRAFARLRPSGVERPLAVAIVGLALAGTALPLLRGQLLPAGSFSRIPSYWSDTATYLRDHAGGNRALLLPASGFGQYTWGRTMDEPLQVLATSPWAVRDQAPLGSPGLTRLLDAIDGRIVAGRPTPGLAPVLARAGVAFLVVRNDLDWRRVGAPSPAQVRAFLGASPGLHQAAAFGPVLTAGAGGLPVGGGSLGGGRAVRAVEIYQIDEGVARVVTYPASGATVVSGGPEALLQLADRGELAGTTVLAGDPTTGLGPDVRSAVTDGLTRRDDDFGLVDNGYSYVLTAGETPAGETGPVLERLPVAGANHQTVATMVGAAAVTASSYATAVAPQPESQPMAAFDGDPTTFWESGAAGDSNGQWVELTLGEPVSFPYVTVRLYQPGAGAPRPTQLAVSTDTGTIVVPVAAGEQAQRLPLPLGATRHLRITLLGVVGENPTQSLARAGVREVTLPGLSVERPLAVPSDQATALSRPAAAAPLFAFDRLLAAPGQNARGNEEDRLDRLFVVPRADPFRLSGTFRAVHNADLDALLTTVMPGWQGADPSTEVNLPCGEGPVVRIDGQPVATSATIALGSIVNGSEVSFSACDAPISLTTGRHRLQSDAGATLSVVSATLAGADWPAPATAAPETSVRSVGVATWGTNHRRVTVGAGAAAVLALSENFSPGWTARMGGHTLVPIRLDGWRQGWIVPAGAGGPIALDFVPDRFFRLALAAGAAALVLLAVLASGVVRRRRNVTLAPAGSRELGKAAIPFGAAALLLVGGPLALAAPAGVAMVPAWRRRIPVVAGGAFVLAGLIEAFHPAQPPASHGGAFGWPAQLAALIAAGAVAAALTPPLRRRRRRGTPGSHFAGAASAGDGPAAADASGSPSDGDASIDR